MDYYPLYERHIKLNGNSADMGISESQKYEIHKSNGYSLPQNDIEQIINMKNFLIKEKKQAEHYEARIEEFKKRIKKFKNKRG